MSYNTILLTLREIYADDIFKGNSVKPHEYRKNPPKKANFPVRAIMYVSRETAEDDSKLVRQIMGEFMMGAVDGPLTTIGYPLPISHVIKYREPIPWKKVTHKIEKGPRPQFNFVYVDPEKKGHRDFLDFLEPYRRQGIPIS